MHGDLSVTSLPRELDEVDVNKAILKALLERAQEEFIRELCGAGTAGSETGGSGGRGREENP